MSWGSVLAGALKLFGAVAAYFRDKQLIDAGKATEKAAAQDGILKNVDTAGKAVRSSAKRDPSGRFVRDDPFDSSG